MLGACDLLSCTMLGACVYDVRSVRAVACTHTDACVLQRPLSNGLPPTPQVHVSLPSTPPIRRSPAASFVSVGQYFATVPFSRWIVRVFNGTSVYEPNRTGRLEYCDGRDASFLVVFAYWLDCGSRENSVTTQWRHCWNHEVIAARNALFVRTSNSKRHRKRTIA